MHIVVSKNDEVYKSLTFGTEVVTIGSDPDVQVYLPDGRIAPRQAELRAVDGGWVVEPLHLEHALILNAEVADERMPLKNGDEIRLGDFVVKVFIDPAADAPQVKTALAEELARIRQHSLPYGSVVRKEEEITLRPAAKGQVVDFALQLPACKDFPRLLHLSVRTLLLRFDARLVWIGLRRKNYGELEYIEGRRKDDQSVGDPPRLPVFLYRCCERSQYLLMPRTEEKDTTSALAIPIVTRRGCLGLIYLDSPAGTKPYDQVQLDELMMYGALLAGQWEAILAGQAQQQEALTTTEWAFVRSVQARLDPAALPQWEQVQLAIYCKPGSERSGDVFDVMRLPNGLAAFLVAHAEALPARSALAMAEVRAAFRLAGMHADPPHILLRALNWMLRADREPCLLHCAVVVMNPKTGACEYATAGYAGALIVNSVGLPRVLADRSIKALGTVHEYKLPARTERLVSPETLVLYSPGCRTVSDPTGQRLKDDVLAGALCDGFGQPASAALDELLADLGPFFKGGRQPDDITMLFVHRI